MAKALPIKTKRRSTAAYAASQPLFDALREGMERLSDQRANLQIARDTVQKLHVKLPSESVASDGRDSHEKYMDSAVKAWRSATESYANIFETLADITAADPTAGREKSDGHEAFKKMHSTAREAYKAAMDWTFTEPRSTSAESQVQPNSAAAKSEDEDREDASDSSGVSPEVKNEAKLSTTSRVKDDFAEIRDGRPTNPILMSLLQKSSQTEDSKANDEQGAEETAERKASPPDSVLGADVKGVKAQKRAQKRQKKKDKRALKEAKGANTDDANPKQMVAAGQKSKEKEFKFDEDRAVPPGFVPRVKGHSKAAQEIAETEPSAQKYDDVSAEVAARLKAKDAKKEVSKEKKRKRESRDSVENGEVVVVKAEKPQKKRAKSNEGTAVEDAAKKEKMRKHVRDAEAEGEAKEEGRKKRMKQ